MTAATDIDVALNGRLGSFELDVAFRAPMRGVTALFGPSGCGKTTILRCMAGLTRLPGRIAVGEDVWQDSERATFLPTHRRHLGYVFQEASLFPHISVRDNLLYGARRTGTARAHQGLGLDDIVDLLGVGHLLRRSPTTLSGGERQRVAVGRALLAGPRVLLMDEPLSALDRMTKQEILPYFEKLHEALALPIVYVSHDLSEVERLADTLVLLEKGRILASGPLHELQTDTRLPLATAPEATATLEGRVAGHEPAYRLTQVSIAGGELVVPGLHGEIGTVRRLRIAASDVSLVRSPPVDSTIVNCLAARILTIDQRDDSAQASIVLALGPRGDGSRVIARITRKSLARLALKPGEDVFAQIKSVALLASRARHASDALR